MKILAFALVATTAAAQSGVKNAPDPLHDGFLQPPHSARPLVWWHWMNGNISRQGIQADLTWMHRTGIGGFQVFDAALSTPQIVDHRIQYMTPEWKDAFRYATTLGDQFGFEMTIAGSPGWSETGGPWVTPREAMKKYTWSEITVDGGRAFTAALPLPPGVTGKFQNTPFSSSKSEPAFYADAAIVAFRTPADEVPHPPATFTSSHGPLPDGKRLSDEDASTGVTVRRSAEASGPWLQAAFAEPITVRSVTLSAGVNGRVPSSGIELTASDDGSQFHVIATLAPGSAIVQTLTFAPVTARFFRLRYPAQAAGQAAEQLDVNEFVLHTEARVHHLEDKAAFAPVPDLYAFATPPVDASSTLRREDVVDLTGKLRSDGTLDWTPPPGRWTILRIGYSLIGTTNHPATKEATGLEVDKLDRRYVKSYMDGYLNSYRDTVGAEEMGKRGIRYVITDSWEAGTQNWTDRMLEQFRKRRGYDATPWLPVLAGHVVESASASDQFLWDFRKTIADLTADEHYGQIQDSLRERGMGHYGESHESGRAFIGDGMEVKKLDDIPMGAMWTQTLSVNDPIYRFNADDRESASVAHLYGQNLAAAESMTAKFDPYAWSPATLKPTADQEFLNGINRIVIHESSHQPVMDKVPGLSLGIYGQWFNRNETWAEEAKPWIDYLARNSYMLQQGRFVADVLYFYGEDSNLTAIFRDSAPNLPSGYGFDYLNADGLIHQVHVEAGQLASPSGMRYKLLVLDPYARHMSLPVLRALHALVEQGAVVSGPKPSDDPSLADNAAEFARLSEALFGDGSGVHTVGKGRVYAGATAAEALQAMKIAPDFSPATPAPGADIEFVHRHTPDAEIYFVDNRSDREASLDATFRVAGRTPELWHSEDGSTEPLSYRIAGDRTAVPLHLEPWGSRFVVFRHPAATTSVTLPAVVSTTLATLQGPWTVAFQPNRGAPAEAVFEGLASWTASTNDGVKYFSGEASYTKTIDAPAAWFTKGTRLWLDLGDVKNLARVTVNGKDEGLAWHAPYRVDITDALKPGQNTVRIAVINSWVNRIIGDLQPGATKYTFIDTTPYQAASPLLPSGLLGPVVVARTGSQ